MDSTLIIIFLIYFLFVISIWKGIYPLGALSAIGMIGIAIFLFRYGISDVNGLVITIWAWINLGMGVYILLTGTMEKIQEVW